eukprot:5552645-Pyramimonas_sp.AAC.1
MGPVFLMPFRSCLGPRAPGSFFECNGAQQFDAGGAVLFSFPQTSQPAEQQQLARLQIFAPGLSGTCYSDCMGAVKLHNKIPA